MDEALRYNQQLQFCAQLAELQQQLCDATFLSDELLASTYALAKFSRTPACVLHQLAAAFPEVRRVQACVAASHRPPPPPRHAAHRLNNGCPPLPAAVCGQAALVGRDRRRDRAARGRHPG